MQREVAKQQAFLASTIENKVIVRHTACGHKETSKPVDVAEVRDD